MAEWEEWAEGHCDALMELCRTPGVSGFEAPIASLLCSRIRLSCDGLSFDPLGNLVAFKRGKARAKKKVLFCAHMDEVGFVVNFIREDGLLQFDSIGISPLVLPSSRVWIGANKIPGILASKPVHLLSESEKNLAVGVEEMVIDIGASSREEAEQLGVYADYAVFDSECARFGDGLVKAKALDDRFGCEMLCELIESELDYDTYFAFTVCEEAGARGAGAVADAIRPDVAVVLECTTAQDLFGVSGADRVCLLGGGAVVPFMDGGARYDQGLYRLAMQVAKRHGICCQTKTAVAGATDAQILQRHAGAVRTLALSLPCRYLHTANCVATLQDMASVQSLCFALAKEVHEAQLDQ